MRADNCKSRIDVRYGVVDVVENAALESARVGIVFLAGHVAVGLVQQFADLPEAIEANKIMAKFFLERLAPN